MLDAIPELDVAVGGELSWDSISPRMGINSVSGLNLKLTSADLSTGSNLNHPIPLPGIKGRETDNE